ncbi:hypothetical protein GGE07_004442 [Sinorhizobium terangae]|nr:hypothetical protein [Sinorhizobium terangae]
MARKGFDIHSAGHIQSSDANGTAGSSDLVSEALQPIHPPCTDQHMGSRGRENACRGLADAATGSRDRDNFALNIRHF